MCWLLTKSVLKNMFYFNFNFISDPSCLSIQENCYTEDCVCNCFTTSTKSSFR